MPIATTLITLAFLAAPQAGSPAPAGAEPSDPAVRAEAAVTANLKTEAGRKYADSAEAAAAAPLAAAVQACRDSLGGGQGKKAQASSEKTAMDVYFLLNRRGGAKAVLARPQSDVGDCLARRSPAALVLPAPPDANYWIKVRVPGAPLR